MDQLKVFKNEMFEVGAVLENGEILFDAEQVAKSLGFVSKTTKNGVEYENVRWSRVNDFLPQVAEIKKGDLIPEPMVYKLAFKASNEVAEQFQDWLAVDVIPSIRKHGAYMTPNTLEQAIANPDFAIGLLTNLKEEQEKRRAAETKLEKQKPKVLFAESVEASQTSILIRELAIILKQNGVDTGERRLYEWMRSNGYLVKRLGTDRNTPTQKSMDMGLFEIKETPINHNSGLISINKTTKVTGKGQVYFINKFLSTRKVV